MKNALIVVLALSSLGFGQLKTPAQMTNAELKKDAASISFQLRRDFYSYAVKMHHNETETKFGPEAKKPAMRASRAKMRSGCSAFSKTLIEGNLLMAELNKRTGQYISKAVLDSWVWFDCDAPDRGRVEKNIKQMEFLADQL